MEGKDRPTGMPTSSNDRRNFSRSSSSYYSAFSSFHGTGSTNSGVMNGETRENVVATLDLHGYTKENAISTMTRFLSEVTSDRTASQLSKVEHRRGSSGTTAASATTSTANAVSDIHHGIWVLIITGTGKHSTQDRYYGTQSKPHWTNDA